MSYPGTSRRTVFPVSLSTNKWYLLAEKQPPTTSRAPSPNNQRDQGSNNEALLQIERERTFREAPRLRCEGRSLAASGFCYSGRDDVVICAFCRGEIHRKKLGNDVTSGHRTYFPNCSFIKLLQSRGTNSRDKNDHVLDEGVEVFRNESNDLNDKIKALSEKIAHLKKENERLKDAKLCLICHCTSIGALLLPCRHLVTCKECSQSVGHCPQCAATVNGKVLTYLA